VGEGATRFSHSGERYILGYGADFFGIWDRTVPGGPVLRYPRNDEGWTDAWNRYSGMEPHSMEVPQSGGVAPDLRTPVAHFRSAHTLAQWVVGLLGVEILLSAVTFGLRIRHVALLRGFERGTTSALDVNSSADALTAVARFAILLLVAVGILWLVWQYRAQSNLRALGASGLRFEPGWVVAWWLIPFANIVFPYLTMRELMKASDPAAGAVDWPGRPTPRLLVAWWAAWLARVPFNVLAVTAAPRIRPAIEQLVRREYFSIGIDVVTIVAAILAILVIREVDARQEKKHARVTAYRASASAWG
jgi:heme/copper-type cytochrome/quinol oxidase subunit 2